MTTTTNEKTPAPAATGNEGNDESAKYSSTIQHSGRSFRELFPLHGTDAELDAFINRAEPIAPEDGIIDPLGLDFHLADADDAAICGKRFMNGTPVTILNRRNNLLRLHQKDSITFKRGKGRAYLLKICGHCLGVAFELGEGNRG